MTHVIRAVEADEWAQVKELRLAALQDPAAHVAFLETYEQSAAQPDSYWQERAAGRSPRFGLRSRQFVAEAPDGSWSGSVALLLEGSGTTDFFGAVVEEPQAHLVGVFVRPEHRGTGLIGTLIAAALDWAWSLEEPRLARVRLFVHEANARAQGAYRRIGFVPTGVVVPMQGDPSAKEFELAVPRPPDAD